jgi:hypothetical protein
MASNSICLNIRPKWPEVREDYVVWCDGREIGRIRLAPDAQGHRLRMGMVHFDSPFSPRSGPGRCWQSRCRDLDSEIESGGGA